MTQAEPRVPHPLVCTQSQPHDLARPIRSLPWDFQTESRRKRILFCSRPQAVKMAIDWHWPWMVLPSMQRKFMFSKRKMKPSLKDKDRSWRKRVEEPNRYTAVFKPLVFLIVLKAHSIQPTHPAAWLNEKKNCLSWMKWVSVSCDQKS